MCLATNLVRRGATYYVRARVPKDLLAHMGRAEIWRSLGTKDPQEARRLLPAAMADLHRLFDDCRLQRDHDGAAMPPSTSPPRFSADELRRFAQEFYEHELATDARERVNGLSVEMVQLRQRTAQIQGQDLGMTGNSVHVHHAADAIFERYGWQVRPPTEEDTGQGKEGTPILRRDDPSYREVCQWLMRAKAEAFHRMSERDRGNFGGRPADSVLAPAAPAASSSGPPPAPLVATPVAQPGETLAELHEKYLAERQDITAEWRLTNRAIIRLFVEHIGAGRAVSSITKRDVRAWKEALLQFPSRGTMRGEKGSFQEIIARNKQEGRPTLSARTINKYLSALRQFAQWLETHEYIDANPVSDDMSLSEGDDQDKRDPFTVEQLQKLFTSPLFTGSKSDDNRELHIAGRVEVRDHRFWLPLLALWTGARLGELAQLQISDVQRLQGVDCININTIGGKRVKRKASKRIVPIHPQLKRLGFLEFIERKRADGADRLFPEIEPDALGRISSDYSKTFAKYARRVGVKTDERLTFHSFRHSFADAMRLAGYPDSTIASIIGQANVTVTASYGSLTEFGPKERAMMVEKVRYGELDLSHLHAPG